MSEILFVCTGNICRSPLAETVLSTLLDRTDAGHRVHVDSAALRAHHIGSPADPRAIAAAARRGYPWQATPARLIEPGDFVRADLVVGMGWWHTERLEAMAPAGALSRIRSLADYAGAGIPEIPDPFHGDEASFEQALDLVEAGCRTLLEELRSPEARSSTA